MSDKKIPPSLCITFTSLDKTEIPFAPIKFSVKEKGKIIRKIYSRWYSSLRLMSEKYTDIFLNLAWIINVKLPFQTEWLWTDIAAIKYSAQVPTSETKHFHVSINKLISNIFVLSIFLSTHFCAKCMFLYVYWVTSTRKRISECC